MFQRNLVWVAGILAATFPGYSIAAALSYRILDLTPDGYTSSEAFDINSSGDAVGIATRFFSGGSENAYFFYNHSAGSSTIFGEGIVSPRRSIVGTGFREVAINDAGVIAGTARFLGATEPPESRGFIYSGGTAGTFTNLGTFFGVGPGSGIRPASDALDINNSGLATGTATSGAAIPEGVDNIDIHTGTAFPITDIDADLTVATRGDFGRAINDNGLIAGSNQDGEATLFSGAAETVLLTGSDLDSASASVATDLNDAGQVTGHTTESKSFIYDTSDTSVTTLPFLGTGIRIFAKAISEAGHVVGWADRDGSLDGQGTGFIYADGTTHRLRDYVVDLTVPAVSGLGDWEKLGTAWGISDDGWIVGRGFRRFDGETFPNGRAYLLIPVSPADFDGDGDVDGDDFLRWQTGFGITSGANKMDGDYDHDGDVDGDDFLGWQSEFGSGSGAASAAVPEPTAALLLLIVVTAVVCFQRCRKAERVSKLVST